MTKEKENRQKIKDTINELGYILNSVRTSDTADMTNPDYQVARLAGALARWLKDKEGITDKPIKRIQMTLKVSYEAKP